MTWVIIMITLVINTHQLQVLVLTGKERLPKCIHTKVGQKSPGYTEMQPYTGGAS